MRSAVSLLLGASLVSAWTEMYHEPFMNKNIDALVVPGTYTSHMHTFFGSDAITNVMPTSADLQQGCYSGTNPNDLSVYWIPTLYYVDGDTFTEVPIFRFSTYYTNAFAEIAIPQDFAMITGNASAQSQAEADHAYNGLEWFCEGSDAREPDIAKFPTSTCEQHLQVSLRFPNCVNPDDLSEYDWSDTSTNKCPGGMKAIPQLRYAARYDTASVVPGGWSGGDAPFQLSCGSAAGGGYCFHADFINGWFEDAAENMLAQGGGGYEDGQFISGSHGTADVTPECTPTDQDPENGTSDYWTSVEMKGGEVPADAAAAAAAADDTASQVTTAAPAATPAADAVSSRRRFKTRILSA